MRFGRPPKKRTKEFYALKAKWEAKKISSRDAAKELGICSTTFLVWCHDSSPPSPPEMSVDEALEILRELKASLYNCTEMQERMSSPRHGISRRSTRSSGMSQTKSGHLQKAKSLYHRKSPQRWPRIKARPIIDLSFSVSGAQENGRLFSALRV